MFKKLVVGALSILVVTALGAGAYNAVTSAQASPAEAQVAGYGAQGGQGGGNQGGNGQAAQASGQAAQANDPAALAGDPGADVNGAQIHATPGATQGGGQGYQGGRGTSEQTAPGADAGTPNPQNGFTEPVTLQGTVVSYAPPLVALQLADGSQIEMQLGNQSFVTELGLTLQPGDAITVIGFWETTGAFAAAQVTIDATGQSYILRDVATGRPAWAGGRGRNGK